MDRNMQAYLASPVQTGTDRNHRRHFFATLLLLAFTPVCAMAQQGPVRPFRFRIKTKTKSVNNVTIQARDYNEALVKLQQRYPGCIVLNYYPDRKDKKR